MFSAMLGALDQWYNGPEDQRCCGNTCKDLVVKNVGDKQGRDGGINHQRSLDNQEVALRPGAIGKLESILEVEEPDMNKPAAQAADEDPSP